MSVISRVYIFMSYLCRVHRMRVDVGNGMLWPFDSRRAVCERVRAHLYILTALTVKGGQHRRCSTPRNVEEYRTCRASVRFVIVPQKTAISARVVDKFQNPSLLAFARTWGIPPPPPDSCRIRMLHACDRGLIFFTLLAFQPFSTRSASGKFLWSSGVELWSCSQVRVTIQLM